jgi:hypothetical protein
MSENKTGFPVRLGSSFLDRNAPPLPKDPVMSNVSKVSKSVKKNTLYRVNNGSSYHRALVPRSSLMDIFNPLLPARHRYGGSHSADIAKIKR